MKEVKIKLSYMNGGKPFIMPNMTVKRQEQITEEMVSLEKKYKKGSEIYNKILQRVILLKTLQVVDNTLVLEDIENMHPNDFAYLAEIAWEMGREIKEDGKDFRKGE